MALGLRQELRMLKNKFVAALVLLLLSASACAELDIRITQGAEGALPIAIAPLVWSGSGAKPENIAGIVRADLKRSGRFNALEQSQFAQPDVTPGNIELYRWRQKAIEYLVVGRMSLDANGIYQIQFQLFDTIKGRQLAGYSIPARQTDLRMAAHQISDLIYEAITGVRGAFNTRIVYVTSASGGGKKQYIMQVADSDGYNARSILNSPQPLMSPDWSPDGRRIAVVSFEKNRAHVYIQDVLTGQRRVVSNFKGINGAPVWSPDGQKLALTLSKTGTAQIYVMDVNSGQLRQVTRGRFISTEPAWMPDGQSLVYTSNRNGKPQVYQISVNGGEPRRLTFEGSYNTAPAVSPDGKKIAMINGDNNRFRVAVLDLETRETRVITNGRLDESPSFAPNGDMIIYATVEGNRGVLAAVSDDGRIRQTLVLKSGEVREPDWSPFLN